MKLLFLGLFILIIVINLIIKYLNIKNKEGFTVKSKQEVNVEKQLQMLNEQDKYYDIRSKGAGSGILIPKKGMSNW